jgi:hypothetical protein
LLVLLSGALLITVQLLERRGRRLRGTLQAEG